ncbi:hypothetical protein IM33_17470 [Clostridioides difficile]|nr:hypothetical protein IM33_17470 [Clostridioides difficile]
MAFKKIKKSSLDVTTPQALFQDLKNRKIQGLLAHQSVIINEYMEKYYNSKNVALELPTGSGKTLVGLLIGEFKRLRDKKRVVYVCPTIQLVNQVVEQSKDKYGIKTEAFTGKIKDYDPKKKSSFLAGDSIAVTTYSSIFNSNTFFDNVDILILDDSHSSDSYISQFWSLSITRENNSDVYINLINIFKDSIGINHYNRLIVNNYDDTDLNWVDKLSIFDIKGIEENITSVIDNWKKEFREKEAWKNIKGYLEACNIYISYNEILIRPMIVPTKHFPYFNNVEQRIYMSATLGESGELERITGIEKIDKVGVPDGWEKQSLGRRFFIFPNSRFEDKDVAKFIVDSINMESRSVFLVPNNKKRDLIKKFIKDNTSYELLDNDDFSESKSNFISKEKSVAVISNRFDGIDFEGDECRLLFICGLPRAMNLQERFFTTRLATSVLFNERIRTRLTQAIGRCTRGGIDYAAICILGSDLEKELVMEEKKRLFHPELAAEIEFGYTQSRELENYDEAITNLNIFKNHGEEWDGADEIILDIRNSIAESRNKCQDEIKCVFKNLSKSAEYEVKFQYALWNKDYKKCITFVNKILENLNDDLLKGYRGYWNYMASYVYEADSQKQNALKCKNKALGCINGLTWLPNILDDNNNINIKNTNTYVYTKQIENIEYEILKLQPGSRKYQKIYSEIINGIDNGGTNIEHSLELLGKLIGYKSGNKTEAAAPDTYWILSDGTCIISECKVKKQDTKPIDVTEIREAKTHKEWLISNNIISENVNTYTVFITNSKYLHKHAYPISNDIYYINIKDIKEFAIRALVVIGYMKDLLRVEGDITLRKKAIDIITTNDFITSSKIIEKVSNSPIKNIESTN